MSIAFEIEPLTPEEMEIHEGAMFEARIYLRCEANLLDRVIAVDRSKFYWKLEECDSTFAYCVKYLNLSRAVALNVINVARKSKEVPQLKLAVRDGDLTISQARKIVPVLNQENQEEWIEKAKTMTQAKLEREVANASPDSSQGERVKALKNDRFQLNLEVSAELMADIRWAQDHVSKSLRSSASFEETLKRVFGEYREKHDPVRKAERHAKRKSKQHVSDSTRCVKDEPILAEVKHALNLRDQGKCQRLKSDGSICGQTRFTDFHHIIRVADGGRSTVENLITLCSSCHRRWHAHS